MRMTDITERGIALVESLEKCRQPFSDLEAIYLCEPSTESISHIIDDFADKPLYQKVHLFFLNRLRDSELQAIKESPILLSRISTLTEINMNYLAVEDGVFHLDMNTAFVSLFNQERRGSDEICGVMVDRLVTLCASLHEYPFIRFQAGNQLTTRIANEFQAKFNTLVNANTSFWWRGDGLDGHGDLETRATLLILDRSFDPISPLLHFFTYQAMVNDLMNIQGDVCKYYKGDLKDYRGQDMGIEKDENVKICLLNDDDSLWKEFRHLHIAQVIQRLSTYLEQYMETSVGKLNSKRGDGDQPAASLEEMNQAVQELPEYKEMMEKHSQHLQIARLCMHKLESQQLLKCADLEQTLVTKVDKEANEVSKAVMCSKLIALVSDPAISSMQKIRSIGLFLTTQKDVSDKDKRAIFEAVTPPLESDIQDSFLSLCELGDLYWEQPLVPSEVDVKSAKQVAKTCAYSYSRYEAKIGLLIEQVCTCRLPRDEYPYVIEPPQLDEVKASPTKVTSSFSIFGSKSSKQSLPSVSSQPAVLSVRSKSKPIPAKTSPKMQAKVPTPKINTKDSRLIVFIAGGATHAELAAVADMMQRHNKDVVVGSTHLLKPEGFVNDLKFLQIGKSKTYFDAIEAEKLVQAEKRSIQVELEPIQSPSPKKRNSFFNALGCGGCMGPPPQSI